MSPRDRRYISRAFEHTPVAALVPKAMQNGVFANGLMVFQTDSEFVLDFYSTLIQPQRFVGRVVLPRNAFEELLRNLEEGALHQEQQFGRVPEADAGAARGSVPPDESRESEEGVVEATSDCECLESLYERLQFPAALLGGAYANQTLIRFTASEFSVDFVATFFPRSVVAARVLVAAARIPTILTILRNALRASRGEGPIGDCG